MDKQYPTGNPELLQLLRKVPFPKHRAKHLLQSIPDLNEPIMDLNGCSTTYLYEAQSYNNLEAVRLLLDGGADPNYENLDLVNDCALWDLQYIWNDEDGAQIRYEIAKRFFEHGANPNLISEDECLYDWVMDSVFNEMGEYGWECRRDFLKLLVIYGGGGKGCYPKPEISVSIDKSRIDEYSIQSARNPDGYHIDGWLVDPDGNRIAKI